MKAPFKPQPMGKLLLGPTWWTSVRDHDHEWITDRYCIVRADLFKTTTVSKMPEDEAALIRNRSIRPYLESARDQSRWIGVLRDSKTRVRNQYSDQKHPPAALLHARNICVFVNSRAWTAWDSTGCTPQLHANGQVVWTATVRGKIAVVGVLMPIHPGGYTNWAGSP